MAAKPIERFIKKQIAGQGGWPRILERIASGETVADVARSLKRPDGQEISRSFLSRMLHDDEARSKAVSAARSEGADAMVDHGLHLVDSAQTDRDSINKAKVQAELRLKVAGFINREQWGESKQAVNVTVNTATLHVDALRHRQVTVPGLVIDGLPANGKTLADYGVKGKERVLRGMEQALLDGGFSAEGSAAESQQFASLTRGTDTQQDDTSQTDTVSVTAVPSDSAT